MQTANGLLTVHPASLFVERTIRLSTRQCILVLLGRVDMHDFPGRSITCPVPAPRDTEFARVACAPNRFVLQGLWLSGYLRKRPELLKYPSLVQSRAVLRLLLGTFVN